MMLLRLCTMATGRTGVRVQTAVAYAAMLSAGITPIVHEYGSLGCSGDLAPLAHCALALMGEGPVRDASGARLDAAEALAQAGLQPTRLQEKEGLALINGTDGMLGMLLLAIADLSGLVVVADITAAMSVEGLLGTDRVFAAELQRLRPQRGQASRPPTSERCWPAVRSSPATEARKTHVSRTPTRCGAPAVAGAVRDTITMRRG